MEETRSALVIERYAALKLNSNLFHARIGLVIGGTQLKHIQDSREPSSNDKQLLLLSILTQAVVEVYLSFGLLFRL